MKTTKQNKETIKLLVKILTVIIIILLALISFVGIYTTDMNTMKNIIPEYKLGMDLYGARNIVIKVDDGTETKKYDANGNLVTDDSKTEEDETKDENITEVEEPINAPELLTPENYAKVKETIEDRLKYTQTKGYLLGFDETTGEIKLEIPENSNSDYIAQYAITKGEFKIVDEETSEVLLSNDEIEVAKVQYATNEVGTTVYLSIKLNKEGTNKLKDISKTYVSSKDSEGNDTTKKISMTLDDETIISTYFQEEITDGEIQLSMGTSTNASDIQNYLQQASNISVFLNTKPMPLTYKMEINRFVYSDITENTIKIIGYVAIAIAVIMAIVMIAKYKKNGVMGVFTNIGFIAILLIALRYGNVVISLSGMFTIAVAVIIEYLITMLILKEYNKNLDLEITNKNIKKLLGKIVISLVPLAIMAVTFAVISWEEISSVGMVLFWALLIMSIYNILILSLSLFNLPKNNNIAEKKEKGKNNKKQEKTKKDNAKKSDYIKEKNKKDNKANKTQNTGKKKNK